MTRGGGSPWRALMALFAIVETSRWVRSWFRKKPADG